jgi:hypothetical protein
MAAKLKTSTSSLHKVKPKKSRKGIIAKSRTSKNKKSKNYLKPYRGQGR